MGGRGHLVHGCAARKCDADSLGHPVNSLRDKLKQHKVGLAVVVY
jgi:hypothetical protein